MTSYKYSTFHDVTLHYSTSRGQDEQHFRSLSLLISENRALLNSQIYSGYLMLGSHDRFLSIDSESHRRKGRNQIDTCLQSLVLSNYLRAVPDKINMGKEML